MIRLLDWAVAHPAASFWIFIGALGVILTVFEGLERVVKACQKR